MKEDSKSSNSVKNNDDLRDSSSTMIPGAFGKKKLKRKFSFSYEESLSLENMDISQELSQIFSDSFNYEKKERSKSIGKSQYFLIFYLFFLKKKWKK